MEKPEIARSNQEIRDEKGRFKEGVSGNPAGKPKGIRHMSTLLEEAIKKVAEGDAEPADILIVKKLIEKAKQGNDKSVEMVFDRLEGKAPQKIDVTSNEKTISVSPRIQELADKLREIDA